MHDGAGRPGQRHTPRIQLEGGGKASHNARPLGRVLDLSTSGVFIESTQRFKPHQEVWVRFEIPDPDRDGARRTIEVLGEVRHQRRRGQPGFGVRFIRLEGVDAEAIRAAVALGGIVVDEEDPADTADDTAQNDSPPDSGSD